MVTLNLVDDFAQHFDFVYANTDDLKRQCYQIRYKAYGSTNCHNAASKAELDIDQYDAHSRHILLRHRASGCYAATIRVIENQDRLKQRLLPFERAAVEPVYAEGKKLSTLNRSSFSEVSRLAISPKFLDQTKYSKLTLGLYLAAISLARLEFHAYSFARLSTDNFKSLRVQGLHFEHANRLPTDTPDSLIQDQALESIYYLNVEAGISPSSPAYHLSQHILNAIAHQIHMPQVLESDDNEESAQSA